MASEQMILSPQPTQSAAKEAGMKSILLHLIGDADQDRRVENALAIARACSAHLTCVHVTPVEAYVAFDSFGGVFVMQDVIKALDERETKMREAMEARLRNEDVSWDYQQVTGSVGSALLRYAALSDLVITDRETRETEYAGPTISFIGDLVKRSRVPVLLPSSDGRPIDPSGPALIAWDGSAEAAYAVRSAVGLLKLAREVRVIRIPEQRDESEDAFPATEVLEYLSRHGIHAELDVAQVPSRDVDAEMVAGMISAAAETGRASYIVMGAFGHSRFGEYLFGGVTRYLLASCPVAMVVAH